MWSFLLETIGWKVIGMLLRYIHKPIGGRLLEAMKRRVEVSVPAEGHDVDNWDANRPIKFIAEVKNPTPMDVTVVGSDLDVRYLGTIVAKLSILEKTLVPKETQQSPVRIKGVLYYPLLWPTGILERNTGWELRGQLRLRCFYETWDATLHAEKVGGQIVISNEKAWQDARDFLRRWKAEAQG